MSVRSRGMIRLFVLATLALPSTGLGSGFYVPATGSPALGSGGAFVASGIDPTAIWHNPANLADLDPGFNFSLDVAGINVRHNFWRESDGYVEFDLPDSLELPEELEDRLDFPGKYDFLPAENRAGIFFLPTAIGAYRTQDWTFGLGVFSPYQGRFRYDPAGATRYDIISNGSFTAYVGGSASWRPTDWLRVGGGLQAVAFGLVADLKAMTPLSFIDEDAHVSLRSFDWTWTYNLGVTLVQEDRFRLGMSMQSPVEMAGDVHVYVDVPDLGNALGLAVRGTEATYGLELPRLWRGGAATKLGSDTWLEAAAVYEPWADLDSVTIIPDGIIVIGPTSGGGTGVIDSLETQSVKYLYENAISLRLGARRHPEGARVGYRAGILWESGAVTEKTYTVATPDTERFGISAGITYGLVENWWLEISAAHYFQKDMDVRESVNEPIAVAMDLVDVSPTNIGHYESQYNIVVFGLRYKP